MSFNIDIIIDKNESTIVLKNDVENCYVKVFSFGAILNAFVKNDINVIVAYKGIEDAIAQKNTWFKSCCLAPFVCRLENGQYKWQNENYTIEKFYLGKHAIHGLIYDASFKIIETIANSEFAQVLLENIYNGFDAGYPFSFKTSVVYTLKSNATLSVKTTIANLHSTSIPISQGWHTYFTLDKNIGESELMFSAKQKAICNNEIIPTNELVAYNNFNNGKKIKDELLDDCFELEPNTSCTLFGKQISLTLTPKNSYPFLQIFIPDHRENIALECLSSLPNSFNNKIGLSVLELGESKDFELELRID